MALERDIYSFGKNVKDQNEKNTAVDLDFIRRLSKGMMSYSMPEIVETDKKIKTLHHRAFTELKLDPEGDEFREFKKRYINPVKEKQYYFLSNGFCEVGHYLKTLQYNGNIQGDFDFKFYGGDKVAREFKSILINDPFIKLAGISPSDFGCKFLVPVSLNNPEHYKEAVQQYYQYFVQKYADDICRILNTHNPEDLLQYCDELNAAIPCYVFIDDDIYVNKRADIFKVSVSEKKSYSEHIEIEYSDDVVEQIANAIESVETQSIEWDDWYQVGYALYNICGPEAGERLFFKFSQRSSKFEHRKTEQTWKSVVKTLDPKAGIPTISKALEEAGVTLQLPNVRKPVSLKDLQGEPDHVIKVDTFLGEKPEELNDYLDEHKNVIIHFTPGGGKTTEMNKRADKREGRSIITSPKVMLMQQQQAKRPGAPCIYERTTKEEYQRAETEKVTFSTWHSLRKVSDNYGKGDEFNIDEIHLMRDGQGYMGSAITDIYRITKNTEAKVFGWSATPDYNLFRAMGYKILKITKKNEKPVRITPKIYDGDTGLAVIAHVKSLDYSGDKVHIVFLNSDSKQKDVEKYLIDNKILKRKEVARVISKERDSEDYQHIIKHEEIRKGVKLVLMTSVGAEGINILNKNVGSVSAFDVRSASTLQQMAGRTRALEEIHIQLFLQDYDHDSDGNAKMGITVPFSYMLETEMNFAQGHLEYARRKSSEYSESNPEHFFNTCGINNIREYVVYDKTSQTYEINLPGVYYKVQQSIDYQKSNRQYFEELSQFATVDEPQCLKEEQDEVFTEIQQKAREERRDYRDLFLQLLESHTALVLHALIEFVFTDRGLITQVREYFKDILTYTDQEVDEFYQANQFIKEVKAEGYIKKLMELRSAKFFRQDSFRILATYGTTNANWIRLKDTLGYLQRLQLGDQAHKFMNVFYSAQFKLLASVKETVLNEYEYGQEVKTDDLISYLRENLPTKKYYSNFKFKAMIDRVFVTTRRTDKSTKESITTIVKDNTLEDFLLEVFSKAYPEVSTDKVEDYIKNYLHMYNHFNELHLENLIMGTAVRNPESTDFSKNQGAKMQPYAQKTQKINESTEVYNNKESSVLSGLYDERCESSDYLSFVIGQIQLQQYERTRKKAS